MAYCTQTDIEAYCGYAYTDFKQGDAIMTSLQWGTFTTALIAGVSQQINLYCNRSGFESTEYTEYHNGRGMTGEKGREYREIDRTFLPREQPVISVTSVSVDTAALESVPAWSAMTVRSALAGGDYVVMTDGIVTRIRFHDEVPRKGYDNVKIIYTAGYASGSAVLNDIKLICLDIIANILAKKKREAEAIVASWGSGTQEGANLIGLLRPEIITDDVKVRLAMYKRSRRGAAWH